MYELHDNPASPLEMNLVHITGNVFFFFPVTALPPSGRGALTFKETQSLCGVLLHEISAGKNIYKKFQKNFFFFKAMELRSYCKILHISYKDHVTNKEVPCQDPEGNWTTRTPPYNCKEMQTAAVWTWFPSLGLAKTILQGTVKEGRRQGRPRKSWEDNIREWTGLEFGKSHKAEENRGKWRKLIAKSSVMSQRLSRLRDRWWWWWAHTIWNLPTMNLTADFQFVCGFVYTGRVWTTDFV